MKPLKDISMEFELRGHRALFFSLMLMILASPFLQHRPGLQWMLSIFLLLVLLTAVRTVAHRRHEYLVAMALGVLALLPIFGVLLARADWLETVRLLAVALFLFWVCGLLLRDIILRSHTVTLELITGAVNIYLMVGLAFGFVFGLVEQLQPGSVSGLSEQLAAADSMSQFMYFSFITLTTLGYGDITPLTPLATTVSYVEAIFGQLYLAILVARLVGLYIVRRKPDE